MHIYLFSLYANYFNVFSFFFYLINFLVVSSNILSNQHQLESQSSPIHKDSGSISPQDQASFHSPKSSSTLFDIPISSPEALKIKQQSLEFTQHELNNRQNNTDSTNFDTDLDLTTYTNTIKFKFPIVNIPQKMQAELSFSRLKYIGEGADERPDMIIQGVTGKCNPGTLSCILAGSNDPTSDILLRVLSGRTNNIGKILGSVTVNDGPLCINEHMNKDGTVNRQRVYPKRVNSAFIARGDSILWPDMTLRVNFFLLLLLLLFFNIFI
jgi:hypothetical protein